MVFLSDERVAETNRAAHAHASPTGACTENGRQIAVSTGRPFTAGLQNAASDYSIPLYSIKSRVLT
jgi:hypothetical protein